MTWHLFGNVLTHHAAAANNRGENEGNITTLQKLLWKGDIHTTVSAEAIRYAMRLQWQNAGLSVNRTWNDDKNDNIYNDEHYQNWQQFIDDDVLGFMRADAAKEESTPTEALEGGKKKRAKGTNKVRRGALEVTRAISTLPFSGDITFNAKSGEKGSTSLYGTELHATRYQYGIAITPERLQEKERIFHVLDALICLSNVAGNQSRFLYDFSPESLILRWTHDMAPRILFSFEERPTGYVSVATLISLIEAQDIRPEELYIGGAINQNPDQAEKLKNLGVNLYPGIKPAVEALKQKISESLDLHKTGSLMGAGV
jgi:CRISPR-associated protein Cst2